MARLPFIDPNDVPGALGDLLRSRPPLDLYRVLPHAPEVAEGFLALGGAILRRASLPPDLRELVILRVGALSKAHYEIHQHRRIGGRLRVRSRPQDGVAKAGRCPGRAHTLCGRHDGRQGQRDDRIVRLSRLWGRSRGTARFGPGGRQRRR